MLKNANCFFADQKDSLSSLAFVANTTVGTVVPVREPLIERFAQTSMRLLFRSSLAL